MEENTRLTDLTRMLLSSPSFSGFLSELSTSGLPAPSTVAPAQNNPTSVPRTTRKDVNPHHAAQQIQNQQPQVNMALLPEKATDFAKLNTSYQPWSSGLSSDFQVYSVTGLPKGPSVETLCGKDDSVSTPTCMAAVKDIPIVQSHPTKPSSASATASLACKVDLNVVLDEEAFSLYFGGDCGKDSNGNVVPHELVALSSDKKPNTYVLSTPRHQQDEDSAQLLARLCKSLDASCERISRHV